MCNGVAAAEALVAHEIADGTARVPPHSCPAAFASSFGGAPPALAAGRRRRAARDFHSPLRRRNIGEAAEAAIMAPLAEGGNAV
jgi:hypothetical protein